MKIAGCVILYKPTEQIFDSIDTYIQDVEKLYVFDNSDENDNIYSLLKKTSYFSKIEYITENKNMGVAYALNVCCKKAIADGYSYILTMDQDSFFKKNSINYMKKLMNNQKVAIIAPNYDINGYYPNDPLVVMTSGNLLNLNIYTKLNGFMEELFIDMVDYEYCLKARTHNYSIVICKNAILFHKLGNIKSIKLFNKNIYYTNHSPIRRYFITRNRLILYYIYKEHYPIFLKKELAYSKREMIKVILFEKNKFKKIKMYFQAKKDYKKWSKKL